MSARAAASNSGMQPDEPGTSTATHWPTAFDSSNDAPAGSPRSSLEDVQRVHAQTVAIALQQLVPALRRGEQVGTSGGDPVVAREIVGDASDRQGATRAARRFSRRHGGAPVVVVRSVDRLPNGTPLVRYAAITVSRSDGDVVSMMSPPATIPTRHITDVVIAGVTIEAPPLGVGFDPWLFLRD